MDSMERAYQEWWTLYVANRVEATESLMREMRYAFVSGWEAANNSIVPNDSLPSHVMSMAMHSSFCFAKRCSCGWQDTKTHMRELDAIMAFNSHT